MKKLLVSMLLVNLLAACASQQPKVAVEEAKPAAVVEAPKSAAEKAAPASDYAAAAPAPVTPVAVDPLNDPNSILAKRSVYYPFDVYAVQDADKPIVQAHASYLSSHANRKVRLEGNCDERGSNEYNLALGDKRANAVRKDLELLGVPATQIRVVSMGEENPRLSCHEEKCWKENRRNDFIHKFD